MSNPEDRLILLRGFWNSKAWWFFILHPCRWFRIQLSHVQTLWPFVSGYIRINLTMAVSHDRMLEGLVWTSTEIRPGFHCWPVQAGHVFTDLQIAGKEWCSFFEQGAKCSVSEVVLKISRAIAGVWFQNISNTIWLFTIAMENHHFVIGKPSISMGHLYHGYVSHNQVG